MKKGWKIFFGICGGVMALGLVLTLTGKAMGTDFSSLDMELKSNILYRYEDRINVWDDNRNDDWDDDWDDDRDDAEDYDWDDDTVHSSESTQKENITAASGQEYSGIQSIDLSVGAGEVIVEVYDGTSVVVDSSGVTDGQKKLSIYRDEEELEIVWKTGVVTTSVGKLKVYVPKAGINEISAKVGAGELTLKGVVVSELDIDLGTGKANIAADVLSEADFDCGAGEMSVSLPGTESDYNYSLRCGIGRINVGGKNYEGLANKTKMNNNAGKYIDIDCGVGEVMVTFQ